jgi:hypothetical protein
VPPRCARDVRQTPTGSRRSGVRRCPSSWRPRSAPARPARPSGPPQTPATAPSRLSTTERRRGSLTTSRAEAHPPNHVRYA